MNLRVKYDFGLILYIKLNFSPQISNGSICSYVFLKNINKCLKN